jgi:hypothetical protein
MDLPVTPERRRLLAVMMLPQSFLMSNIAICEYANISPRTYYNALRDPIFNEYQTKLGRSIIKSNALKSLHKHTELALKGDRQALERQLEQNGTLDPKETTVNVNRTDALKAVKDKTMAGLEAFGEPVEAEYTIESEGIDNDEDVCRADRPGDVSDNGKQRDNQCDSPNITDGPEYSETTPETPAMPDTDSDRGEGG